MSHIVVYKKASPFIGRWLLHLDEVDSTNTLALHSPELLAKSGLVILADYQSSGRGRRGRPWCSHIVGNLYASFVLHDFYAPPVLPYITLLVGVALLDTVKSFGAWDASIKWPNDILIRGKKVAGILVETRPMAGGGHAMVIGVGVNLKGRPEGFPPELRAKVIAIEEVVGRPVDRFAFLDGLIEELNNTLHHYREEGPSAILERWEQGSSSIGRRVEVQEGTDSISGQFLGLSPKGHFLLKTEEGVVIEIISGDVIFLD